MAYDLDLRLQSALAATNGDADNRRLQKITRFDSLFLAANQILPVDKRINFVPHSQGEMARAGETLIDKGLYPYAVVTPVLGLLVKKFSAVKSASAGRIVEEEVKMADAFRQANDSLPAKERLKQPPTAPGDPAAARLVTKFMTADRVRIFNTNMSMAAALEVAKKENPALIHRQAAATKALKRRTNEINAA